MKEAMIVMTAAALNAVSVAEASIATADFTKDVGPVRPELHSSGFGPTICSQTAQDLADVKAMGFKAARTHDWHSSTRTSAAATGTTSSRLSTSTRRIRRTTSSSRRITS